jgi:hypothetical protein
MLVFWVVMHCGPAGTPSEERTTTIFSPEDGGSMFSRNVDIYL